MRGVYTRELLEGYTARLSADSRLLVFFNNFNGTLSDRARESWMGKFRGAEVKRSVRGSLSYLATTQIDRQRTKESA